MPRWFETINLSEVWDKDRFNTFEDHRDAIVSKLKESFWYKASDEACEDLAWLVDELGDVENYSDFNFVFNRIYDVADEDRVWIDTCPPLPVKKVADSETTAKVSNPETIEVAGAEFQWDGNEFV